MVRGLTKDRPRGAAVAGAPRFSTAAMRGSIVGSVRYRERVTAGTSHRTRLAFAALLLAGFMLALSVYFRLTNLGFPATFQFDEHHFVENARNYLAGREDWNDHPPLGKLFIALSIAAFACVRKKSPRSPLATQSKPRWPPASCSISTTISGSTRPAPSPKPPASSAACIAIFSSPTMAFAAAFWGTSRAS